MLPKGLCFLKWEICALKKKNWRSQSQHSEWKQAEMTGHFVGDSPHPQLPFGGFWWNTDKLSDAVPAPFCPAPFQHGSQPNLQPDRWRNEQSQRPIKSSCHPPTKPQRHTWRTWTYLNGTLFCKRWASNCWVSNKYPPDPIVFNIGTTTLRDLSSLRKVAPLSLRGFPSSTVLSPWDLMNFTSNWAMKKKLRSILLILLQTWLDLSGFPCWWKNFPPTGSINNQGALFS